MFFTNQAWWFSGYHTEVFNQKILGSNPLQTSLNPLIIKLSLLCEAPWMQNIETKFTLQIWKQNVLTSFSSDVTTFEEESNGRSTRDARFKITDVVACLFRRHTRPRVENTHLLCKGKYHCVADPCLTCLESATLLMLNEQQISLFGQIRSSQTGGQPCIK